MATVSQFQNSWANSFAKKMNVSPDLAKSIRYEVKKSKHHKMAGLDAQYVDHAKEMFIVMCSHVVLPYAEHVVMEKLISRLSESELLTGAKRAITAMGKRIGLMPGKLLDKCFEAFKEAYETLVLMNRK